MHLDLNYTVESAIFLPYQSKSLLSLHLLFLEPGYVSGVDVVKDSDYQALDSFFQFGKLMVGDSVVGHAFYSHAQVQCTGTCILAYSNSWKTSLNTHRTPIKPFGMQLVAKSDQFIVFHRRNLATLVTSPQMATSIQANLEV